MREPAAVELRIERLASQGEGLASGPDGPVHVPFALPGELVRAVIEGDRGTMTEMIEPAPERVQPVCPHFGRCGGCVLQHASIAATAAFKRDLVQRAFAQRGLPDVAVEAVNTAPLGSRRRAVLVAMRTASGIVLGYHESRSERVVPIEACPVLRPAIVAAFPAIRSVLEPLLPRRGRAQVTVIETPAGLDVAVSGLGADPEAQRRAAAAAVLARAPGLARLSLEGEALVSRQPVEVRLGSRNVPLPPGAFVQAVGEAESEMIRLVVAAVGKARPVADLFAGLGTFALALAERAEVTAVESDGPALKALAVAAARGGLKPITPLRRDLFREPLSPRELDRFGAVVLDPPRAGAKAQAEALAGSSVPVVVAVSCNPATLARDVRTLLDGGYALARVTPIDQFLFAPHVEVVAELRRNA